jgi:hypothetical protein
MTARLGDGRSTRSGGQLRRRTRIFTIIRIRLGKARTAHQGRSES